MGFKISWIAFEGANKAQCLEWLCMIDTREIDETNEAPFSISQLPTGWCLLFANSFDYVSDKRLAELSKHAHVIACQVHEGLMYARTSSFVNGESIWSVVHDAQKAYDHLSVTGALPEIFKDIHQRWLAEQAENGGTASDVDYIFEIPVELASHYTGYRHDQWKFDWGEPQFTEARPEATEPKPWWQKFFGKT